jgi:dipeptidyl-peptidase 4
VFSCIFQNHTQITQLKPKTIYLCNKKEITMLFVNLQRILSIHLFFVLFFQVATAQNAKISMEDAILKGRGALAPANLKQLQWIPGSNQYTHVVKNKIVRSLAENPLTTDTLDILTPINANFAAQKISPLEGMPPITWVDRDQLWFHTEKDVFTFSLKNGLIKENSHPSDCENIDYHLPTYNAAYTLGNALFVSKKGEEKQIVKSEEDGIVYGKSVHREEFGIYKGTFWSPSGQKLAFYRMDERMVTQYPIYQLDTMPATVRNIRYPYAGSKSHQVTIGVYDWLSEKTIYLQTDLDGEKDHFLTNVEWSPDDKYILVAIVNRAQNHNWLNLYDAKTGQLVRTIFEETNDKWIEPEKSVVFLPGKNDEFLWQSEKDGFNHLYRYNLNGKLLAQISQGKFPVTNFYGFSNDGDYCFFQAADESGLNRYLYKSKLKNGEMMCLNNEEGTHQGILNKSSDWILDVFSNLKTPRTIYAQNTKNPKNKTSVFSAKNPLENFAIGETRFLTIPSKGGQTLNARVILPPNFDATKKYPALVYTYNGPHVQMVTNTWLGNGELWMHHMAQDGFIQFSVDGRGSMNRGAAFENAIHRQCGTSEVEDQVTATNFLKNQGFVDSARVGIYGWSYGGFMATSLLTRPEAKGVFACGVAGGPVIDWSMYEIMYTERYMDTPQENPEGYAKASLFNYIDNLDKRLLMIHGSSDDVVLWQNSLKYIRECVRKGKQIDYFVYPEHLHNVIGKDRVHLFLKIEQFFKDNLKTVTP